MVVYPTASRRSTQRDPGCPITRFRPPRMGPVINCLCSDDNDRPDTQSFFLLPRFMSVRLYIGNLPQNFESKSLKLSSPASGRIRSRLFSTAKPVPVAVSASPTSTTRKSLMP